MSTEIERAVIYHMNKAEILYTTCDQGDRKKRYVIANTILAHDVDAEKVNNLIEVIIDVSRIIPLLKINKPKKKNVGCIIS